MHRSEAGCHSISSSARTSNVGETVTLVELDLHINDPAFADAMAEQLLTNLAGSMHAVHRA